MTVTLMYEDGEYTVEAQVSYDPGTPRSYASGGSPGGWDVEDVTVTDWDGTDVTDRMLTDRAFEKAVDEAIDRGLCDL